MSCHHPSSRVRLVVGVVAGLALAGVFALAGCQKPPGQLEKATEKGGVDERPAYAQTSGATLDRGPAKAARAAAEARAAAAGPDQSEALKALPDPESLPADTATYDESKLDTPPSDPANPGVVITMGDGREIVIELFAKEAPKTVAQFMKQVSGGFHQGDCFHRSDDLCIQGGDPVNMKGREPWPSIPLEVTKTPFDLGSVGLARASDPNSGNSQFFIIKAKAADAAHLNTGYCNFGRVLKGMDVVTSLPPRKLGASEPIPAVARIKSMTLTRFGAGADQRAAS
jgi:cyclophilin family peptidyl-prolyl cis-trans isomerase